MTEKSPSGHQCRHCHQWFTWRLDRHEHEARAHGGVR